MAAKKRKLATKEPAGLKHSPFQRLSGSAATGASSAPAGRGPGPSEQAAAQAPQLDGKLVLQRELKGRGGKTVTRIRGLRQRDLEALASLLKKKLGCGALVEGADLLLLGDLVDRAADWLQAQGATRVIKGN